MPRREPETISVERASYTAGDGWLSCDVFEHNGRRWLVGLWVNTSVEGFYTPERMVLLEGLEASHIGPADSMNPVDWIVPTPLPASIFDLRQPLPGCSGHF